MDGLNCVVLWLSACRHVGTAERPRAVDECLDEAPSDASASEGWIGLEAMQVEASIAELHPGTRARRGVACERATAADGRHQEPGSVPQEGDGERSI